VRFAGSNLGRCVVVFPANAAYDFRVNTRRLTAVGAVIAAFLVLPAGLSARDQVEEDRGTASEEATIATGKRLVGVSAASVQISTGTGAARRAVEASASAVVAVTMGDYFFRPRDVAVSAGDSVRWNNVGRVPEGHTATGEGFDSGVLEEGESFTHRFTREGTFDYVCTLHPAMTGTVTVSGAPTAGGGGGQDGGDSGGGGSGSGDAGGEGGATGGISSGSSGATGGASGGSLPATGLNLILLVQIGVGLIAGGALLSRLLHA
jgi:plastocyanin